MHQLLPTCRLRFHVTGIRSSYWANQHEINVKMLTEGRLADSEWWVEDKDYSNAAAR